MKLQPLPLILASSSSIRKKILGSAGLKFSVSEPNVDEAAIKANNQHLTARKLVEVLAIAKALRVKQPANALVLAGDQVLELDGKILDKVKTMQEAKQRLLSLRGKEHHLTGATILAKNGQVVWKNTHSLRLEMLEFTEKSLDLLLEQTGKKILASVGCYELEAEGIRLFKQIDKDYTAMLGLPILPVLKALRKHGGLND